MKLAARLVIAKDGTLAYLKKAHKFGNSSYILIPKEWLYSIGETREFLIYIEDGNLVIRPYRGDGEVVLDTRGTSDRD